MADMPFEISDRSGRSVHTDCLWIRRFSMDQPVGTEQILPRKYSGVEKRK